VALAVFDIPVPAGDGVGAAVDVSSLGIDRTIEISGSIRAVIVIEASNDGQAFVTLAATSSPLKIAVGHAFASVRIRVVNTAPGAVVAANADISGQDSGTSVAALQVPAGDGNGASLDVSSLGTLSAAIVAGAFSGIIEIQGSLDGSAWLPCASLTAEEIIPLSPGTAFVRVVRKNVDATSPGTPTVVVSAGNAAAGGGAPVMSVLGPVAVNTPAQLGSVLLVDSSASPIAVPLPAITPANAGQIAVVKNSNGSGFQQAITISPSGTDTVDGQAAIGMTNPAASVGLMSDGVSDWRTIWEHVGTPPI